MMTDSCGLNDRGVIQSACRDGVWSEWSACDDGDECGIGDSETRRCEIGNHTQQHRCADGKWSDWSRCPLPCTVERSGVCWYLGEPGKSCNDVCELQGGYAPEAGRVLGTTAQGGSVEACTEILILLGALGQDENAAAATRSDGRGIGCHAWSNGLGYWLADPDFSPGASVGPARIACGCAE